MRPEPGGVGGSPRGSIEQGDIRVTHHSQRRYCGSIGLHPIMAFIPQTAGVLLKGVRGLLPWKLRGKSKYAGSCVFVFTSSIWLSSSLCDTLQSRHPDVFALRWTAPWWQSDGLWSRRFRRTFVCQILFYYQVELSHCLSRLGIKTVDIRLVFWIQALLLVSPCSMPNVAFWCESRSH